MSAFFIKHPAIAAVIAIVTTLLGLVCMFNLPISQYPEITPRTIQLQAMFPGASAQAVADSVGTPLERQISGVQGMDYMTSVSSNNGVYNLSVIFEPGSDTDIDQVLTNMRYGQASSQLPQEVQSTGVTIKQQPGLPLMIYSLTSPDGSYNSVDLANYAQVKLVDELKRVEGVGEVQVYGAGRYAIRIWLDTSKMTHYGVSVNEVRGAISAQNTTNPGGKIGADPVPDGQEQTITVRTQGRLSEPHEFEDIIIRQNGDEILYLFGLHMHIPQKLCQGDGIGKSTAWVTGHKVRYEILFLSQFAIGFVEPVFKSQKGMYISLSHQVRYVFYDVFRCHFQLAADVIPAQFFYKFFIMICQKIIIAQSGTDKYFFDAGYTADFLQ